jgi:uroporphyrinogen decarboxylase
MPGMFETFGRGGNEPRKASTLAKLDRVRKTFRHEEADRVPITDFFWGSFKENWRRDLGLPADADPYYHYDLDYIVTVPNMDPHIRAFETISEDDEEVVVKTGFETTIRKRFDLPMPEQVSWETDTLEKMEAFEFDDPWDRRRYFEAGDNQIAGVGDGFERNSPPWVETVKSLHADFPVFGSVTEASEITTRLLGQLNTLMWIGEEPERFGEQLLRIGEFSVEIAKAQIEAADGLLDGLVIWGDVAYRKSLFMGPAYWRKYYKPTVAKIIEVAHQHGLITMYHGCGNANAILEDMIEIGLDGYNPLEAKAELDVVDLRERLGHRLTFCGNSDIRVWERGDPDEVRREVLHRLRAAEGGGYVFMSDHSVATDVSGQTYDQIVKLVREYGVYPLNLPAE